MRILIVRNNSNPQALDAALLLATYLSSQGIDSELVDASQLEGLHGAPCPDPELDGASFDMAVALGGDGTILRTAGLIGSAGVPILGINFGWLGFLANGSDDGVVAIVAAALAGDVTVERRANLRIDVFAEGDDLDDLPVGDEPRYAADGSRRTFFALNEITLARGASGRIVEFSLSVSGTRIADLRGDGAVVATATGSTAYALSAGGPIVSPQFEGLEVVPIAPHTLSARPIVCAPGDVVEIDLSERPSSREAVLFADGDPVEVGAPIARMVVRRGSEPTVLLRYKGDNFYEHVARTFF